MTPRRLIRWKSFWLGILVLGFLGWAWVRSVNVVDRFSWIEPFVGIGGELSQAEGWIGFAAGENLGPSREYTYSSSEFLHEEWPVRTFRLLVDEDEVLYAGISHWFLILLFLVPWSAFLAWRWRRQRILTRTHDAAPAL